MKLMESSQDWWHDFWSNSFVHLSSADGEADYVEQHYNYFLYVMASSSRGAVSELFSFSDTLPLPLDEIERFGYSKGD